MLGPFLPDSLKQPRLTVTYASSASDSDPEEMSDLEFFFELYPFVLGSVLCDLPKLIVLITVHVLCHLSSHECAATEKRLSH